MAEIKDPTGRRAHRLAAERARAEKGARLLTIAIASEMIGLPTFSLRELCRGGLVKSVKLGGRRYIPNPELQRVISDGVDGGDVRRGERRLAARRSTGAEASAERLTRLDS